MEEVEAKNCTVTLATNLGKDIFWQMIRSAVEQNVIESEGNAIKIYFDPILGMETPF